MIVLKDVCMRYATRQGRRLVLDHVNMQLSPGEKIGILGRNGAGKSTLIRLIGGIERPSSGAITRQMAVSWPLAFAGGFQGSLTGVDNIRFICRIYGADFAEIMPKVEDFSELGAYLREPLKRYSTGMSARLAFGISLAIDFDCYLIDEVTAVGDKRFHEKCQTELFDKRKHKSMIIVSHMPSQIFSHCDKAAVLHAGKLFSFDNVSDAYEFYQAEG